MSFQETVMQQHRAALEQTIATRPPGTAIRPLPVAPLAAEPFDVGHWCGAWFFVDRRGLVVGVVRGTPIEVQFQEYDTPRAKADALALERAYAKDCEAAMVRRAKYGGGWMSGPLAVGEL